MNLTFSLMPHSPDLDDTDLKFLDKLIRSPISGPFYRYRFQMALDALLPPYERVLEIGYGSGLLAFVLAPVTEEYVAVDIHSQPEKVELSLKEQGRTNVKCNICDARNLSQYEAEYFDLVVSVSCLEHIRETIEVQKEVHRVLKAGGKAVYGLPIKNVMTKILFRLVGYEDSEIHPTAPEDVINAACVAGLALEHERFFPSWAGYSGGLYWVGRFVKG